MVIPLNKRSKDVQREIQEMGRTANKKKRREKMAIKECLKLLIEQPITIKSVKKVLTEMGIEDEYQTNAMYKALSLFKLGVVRGDLAAIKYIDELLGESPLIKLKKEEMKLKREEHELAKQKATGQYEVTIDTGDPGNETESSGETEPDIAE